MVGLLSEIRTSYQGFETNVKRYFVYLLVYSKNYSHGVHEPELATGNGFTKDIITNVNITFAQYNITRGSEMSQKAGCAGRNKVSDSCN